MKVETNIWTVVEGELKEIKFNDTLFTVHKKKEADTKQTTLEDFGENFMSTTKPESVTKMIKEKFEVKPEGKKIGEYNTNGIYLNVYNDVKKWVEEGLERDQIAKKLHEIYKPNIMYESCKSLVSCYIRYLQGLKPKQKKGAKKGKVVGSHQNNFIYENPYNDVKQALDNDKPWSFVRDNIIKRYYPNYKKVSLNTMASVYKKFVEKKKPKTSYYRMPTIKEVKDPNGLFAKSESYAVNITNLDVKKIKSAINAVGYNYKPTFANIMNKTELKYNRVRGALDVMLEKGLIKTEQDGYNTVYMMNE